MRSSSLPPDREELAGTYEHYSGKTYKVIGLAKHTESDEPLVLYLPLYDCDDLAPMFGVRPFFVRPLGMFFEEVVLDGVSRPRFKRVGD